MTVESYDQFFKTVNYDCKARSAVAGVVNYNCKCYATIKIVHL
jgi:hypothetical protein